MTDVPFGQKVRFPITFVDAAGVAAKVDGIPVIETTFGTVIETVATGDGFSTLIAPGGIGSGTVTGTADVDLGEGVKPLKFVVGDIVGLASPEAAAAVIGEATIEP